MNAASGSLDEAVVYDAVSSTMPADAGPMRGGGETIDFAATLRDYEAPLLRYAMRFVRNLEEAQDIVQDAFLRLHDHTSRRGGRFEGSLSAWLYRVTHNLAMDVLRKEGRARAHRESEMQQPQTLETEQPDLARREGERLAREKLRSLDDREQQVVILKVEQDLSYKEIAAVMQLSVGNVGYILHHALKKLARMLQEEGAI